MIAVDPDARTAEVQGMTTYEHLVDATLPHGLMPTVVPQLKTITLGGAVTGLGIESTSFRHGLPHESVREMDVLTADGEVITATADGPHADLYRGFANSYGTLGYALRLLIELLPVRPVRPAGAPPGGRRPSWPPRSPRSARTTRVDFVDGTVFGPGEQYLTVGTFTDDPGPGPSDYTGQQIFYRSIRERAVDHLTVHDYLWRWDTDWFWCSRAFGVQHPVVRRLWPRRYRRSDVYRRLVALDRRTGLSDRVRRLAGLPQEEPVIQDVEIPVDRLAEFLDAFHPDIGITPGLAVPVAAAQRRSPGRCTRCGRASCTSTSASGRRCRRRPGDPEAHNRRIEQLVADLGGHKSLYSTVHYSEDEFWKHYNGPAYRALKQRYDPDGRLPDLYHKVASGDAERQAVSGMQVATIISRVVGPDVPVRVIGYDGSKAGPDSSDIAMRITSPRALARLATAPGTLGLARATSRARSRSTATSTSCWTRWPTSR